MTLKWINHRFTISSFINYLLNNCIIIFRATFPTSEALPTSSPFRFFLLSHISEFSCMMSSMRLSLNFTASSASVGSLSFDLLVTSTTSSSYNMSSLWCPLSILSSVLVLPSFSYSRNLWGKSTLENSSIIVWSSLKLKPSTKSVMIILLVKFNIGIRFFQIIAHSNNDF